MNLRQHLLDGQVIPAHPLALDERRRLDEESQVGLTRYYLDSGARGMGVGVHTTQFAIREVGLYESVLRLAVETVGSTQRHVALIAGICGRTEQAVQESLVAASLGYHDALLSLGAWGDDD